MHQECKVGYFENPGCQGVRLPYRGGDFEMVVLLPARRDGLRKLESRLSPSMFCRGPGWRSDAKVEIFLPRFKVTWGVNDLREPLQELGMRAAFDQSRADFSGINGAKAPAAEALFVSNVLHKAFSEVNEEGTEAAAATLAIAAFLGLPGKVEPPIVFRADHPFVYAIMDGKSGAILFLGRVVDPTREGSTF